MEGTACLGCEDLLGFDVEKEGFDGSGGVPFLVKKEGEVLDVGWGDGAVSIVEIGKYVTDRAVSETTLAYAEGRFVGIGDGAIECLFDDTVNDLVV